MTANDFPWRIAIVIPVHNRKIKTLRCLESLSRVRHDDSMIVDVIIVDDGSTDGTSEAIRQSYPYVHILNGSGSLYWTAAINLGIQKAMELKCKWVLLLNDDTVHDGEFLLHLLNCARKHPDAIIGAKIMFLSNPEMIRFAGAAWKMRGWYYPDAGRAGSSLGAETRTVESLNGNCCLIPTHLFLMHGQFDERNLPHCYADSAFCIQVRKKGISLLLEPKACVWDDDSDILAKLSGPRLRGSSLIKHVFFSKLSAYYWRALPCFYWQTAPSKLSGMLVIAYRLARISIRVFLALVGIRPFYKQPTSGFSAQ